MHGNNSNLVSPWSCICSSMVSLTLACLYGDDLIFVKYICYAMSFTVIKPSKLYTSFRGIRPGRSRDLGESQALINSLFSEMTKSLALWYDDSMMSDWPIIHRRSQSLICFDWITGRVNFVCLWSRWYMIYSQILFWQEVRLVLWCQLFIFFNSGILFWCSIGAYVGAMITFIVLVFPVFIQISFKC